MHMGKSRLSLNKHFAALGAAAAAVTGVGVAQHAVAAIVYSGPQNLNIPVTTAGIYLNLVTGVSATTPAGAPGWDVNPWGSSSFNVWANNSASPNDGVISGGGSSTTLVDNLPVGFAVDGTSTYARSNGIETTGTTAFTFPGTNYVGIRFQNENTGQQNFGWIRFSTGATQTSPRTVVDWAYENTGAAINVGATGGGATPEPASLGLLALGAVGLLRRRSA